MKLKLGLFIQTLHCNFYSLDSFVQEYMNIHIQCIYIQREQEVLPLMAIGSS